MHTPGQKRKLDAILVLAVLGIGLSTYSFLHHFSFVSGSFCDLSSTFNCDIVNRGAFSTIYGIPVALFGILGYTFLGAAALLKRFDVADRTLSVILVLAALGGLGFAGYLTGIEAFVLKAWCIVCLTSQFTILAVFALTVWFWYVEKKNLIFN
jgi:uncharacterized membrane protein